MTGILRAISSSASASGVIALIVVAIAAIAGLIVGIVALLPKPQMDEEVGGPYDADLAMPARYPASATDRRASDARLDSAEDGGRLGTVQVSAQAAAATSKEGRSS